MHSTNYMPFILRQTSFVCYSLILCYFSVCFSVSIFCYSFSLFCLFHMKKILSSENFCNCILLKVFTFDGCNNVWESSQCGSCCYDRFQLLTPFCFVKFFPLIILLSLVFLLCSVPRFISRIFTSSVYTRQSISLKKKKN